MLKDKSPFPDGTDGGNDNIEGVETWEPLRIIGMMDVKIIDVEELKDWEPLRIILKGEGE